MGVDYQRWLMAKGSYFSPSAAAVVKLVERLRAEKWIAPPGSPEAAKLRYQGKPAEHARATGGYAVSTVENTFGKDAHARLAATVSPQPAALSASWLEDPDREELRLVWPVEGEDPLPLKYPLSQTPEGSVSYALELHRAHDYVYPTSASIGLVPTLCRCGEDLSFEWDDEELVPAFGASTGISTECEECSRTFDPSQGLAMITRPFDGTREEVRGGAAYRFALKVDCGPCFVADARLAFARDLVELVENEFGRSFYEIGCTDRARDLPQ